MYFDSIFKNASQRLVHVINNKTPFENKFFHFIFSEQVFEHVKDIDTAICEISRISAPKAKGYHRFPPTKKTVEEHVKMPFVHWIPKSAIRFPLILLYVLLKKEPFWKELNGKSAFQKSKVYYNYLKNHTFYRSWFVYKRIFKKHNFNIIINNSNYRNTILMRTIRKISPKLLLLVLRATRDLIIYTEKQ